MQMIVHSISGLFIYSFYVCCWYYIANKKIDFKNIRLYVFGVFFMIVGTIISIFTTPFIKIILMFIVLCFMARQLVFDDLKEALLSVLVVQLIVMICEALFVVFISLLNVNIESLSTSLVGDITINLCVSILAFLTIKIKIPNKLYELLYKSSDCLKNNSLLRYTLIMIVMASFFTSISYTKLDKKYILIINTMIVICYVIVIFLLSRLQNNYQKISNKYSSSIESLKEYENMIEKYKISSHESKSELNRILEMVSRNDPDTIRHIETMLNTRIKENEKIMKQTSKIPSGGLRATIYSKMCIMEDKNIKNTLNISREVKTSELLNLDEEVILNICKILGVYLDNAIEAVNGLEEKCVLIEIYKEDERLLIAITNNFRGRIEARAMDKPGYTTKGEGHGYGLSLVKEIVSSNRQLSVERKINNDTITHTLAIKLI